MEKIHVVNWLKDSDTNFFEWKISKLRLEFIGTNINVSSFLSTLAL